MGESHRSLVILPTGDSKEIFRCHDYERIARDDAAAG
jgi:hypothetical protein